MYSLSWQRPFVGNPPARQDHPCNPPSWHYPSTSLARTRDQGNAKQQLMGKCEAISANKLCKIGTNRSKFTGKDVRPVCWLGQSANGVRCKRERNRAEGESNLRKTARG